MVAMRGWIIPDPPPGVSRPPRLRTRSLRWRITRRCDIHPWIPGRSAGALRARRAVPAEEGLGALNDPVEEGHVDQERHGDDRQDDEPDEADRRPHEAIEWIQMSARPRPRHRGAAHDDGDLIIDVA